MSANEARRESADRWRRTAREVVGLAWPIAAAMIGEVAIGLVDTKLVGGLGAASLGGVGVANTLMYLSYSFVQGLVRGVKVRTAYAVGEGRPEDGRRYAIAGMAMAGCVGMLVFWLARDVGWILRGLHVDPALHRPAQAFLAARTWDGPATCMMAALIQHRQALGDARTPMVVGIAGNLVNATLAWSLVYGHLGLPALGVAGAGYATALTEWLELGAMLWLFARERDGRRSRGRLSALPLARAIAEVCGLGVPTGLQFGAEMLAFTSFTAILGAIGGAEIAAHAVALSIIRVSFLPGIAVGEAASVLVGQSLGRRDLASADRVTAAAISVSVLFMAACGAVFGLSGETLTRAFTTDADVVRIGRRLLLIAALFQVLDAVSIVLRGALRGARDVRVVAAIGIAVIWICVPGAAWLLGQRLGMGAVGGWIGFVAETTLGAVLFGRRWVWGAWRREYASFPRIDDGGDEPEVPEGVAAR